MATSIAPWAAVRMFVPRAEVWRFIMSRSYNMTVIVERYIPAHAAAIRTAAETEWNFDSWDEIPGSGEPSRLIGSGGASIVSRVMGLILASIAATHVLEGAKEYFQ